MGICWITINVGDLDASKAFYGDFLGLPLARQFAPNENMTIAFFGDGQGTQIELIAGAPAPFHGSGVSVGLETPNYDALLQKARAQGLLRSEPTVLGGHTECFFACDPDGVGVQIIKAQ